MAMTPKYKPTYKELKKYSELLEAPLCAFFLSDTPDKLGVENFYYWSLIEEDEFIRE